MITVIMPENQSQSQQCQKKAGTRMEQTLLKALEESGFDYNFITTSSGFDEAELKGRKLIFAIALNEGGENVEYYKILGILRRDPDKLEGCVAGLIIDGKGPLYTKSVARHLGLAVNNSGSTILGKGLVEATGNLDNFHILAETAHISCQEAYKKAVSILIGKLHCYQRPAKRRKKLLVLHSSERTTSNSLMLWDYVKGLLPPDKYEITEISLRDGQVIDCRGCSYETCIHLGEQGQCFYGGIIVEQVYPAMIDADIVMLVCPNYNDALGAHLTAYINRLTAIFRCHDFSNKEIRAIIVSGYSGGDIVAEQIMGAMCFNKSMLLPPRFVLMETAHNPMSVMELEGIKGRIESFLRDMI